MKALLQLNVWESGSLIRHKRDLKVCGAFYFDQGVKKNWNEILIHDLDAKWAWHSEDQFLVINFTREWWDAASSLHYSGIEDCDKSVNANIFIINSWRFCGNTLVIRSLWAGEVFITGANPSQLGQQRVIPKSQQSQLPTTCYYDCIIHKLQS